MKNFIEPVFQLEKNISAVVTIGHQVTETEIKILFVDFYNNYSNIDNGIEKFSIVSGLTIQSINFIISKNK